MHFKRLTELELTGKRVFIRADLNVPQSESGSISDDTRIRASLAAIRIALDGGAAAVMVTSHLGRPTEGDLKQRDSLAPIAARMSQLLGQPVRLVQNWVDGGFEVQPGEVVMLENCRANRGEKSNSATLAARMAKLCDVYVYDAFTTAHRNEATIHALAMAAPVACAGSLMAAELDALGRALETPERPMTAIVGGAKVSTKLGILDNLADKVDQLIVGGGIANTFMLAAGMPVGKSLVEPDLVEDAKRIIIKMAIRGALIPMPTDVVVAKEFSPTAKSFVKAVKDVAADDMILDIGPVTTARIVAQLANAKTIVWNGPVGVFEFDAFAAGTRCVGEAVAASEAMSLAGGGDTIAAITKFSVADGMDYISTAGGAFLEYLEGKRMPAVEALQARAQE